MELRDELVENMKKYYCNGEYAAEYAESTRAAKCNRLRCERRRKHQIADKIKNR